MQLGSHFAWFYVLTLMLSSGYHIYEIVTKGGDTVQYKY